jgi:hypothetical protein
VWAVELRREESRRAPQDRIRPTQLAILPLKLDQPDRALFQLGRILFQCWHLVLNLSGDQEPPLNPGRNNLAAFQVLAGSVAGQKVQRHPVGAAKKPGNLTEKQQVTLEQMCQDGGLLWQAYQLKESLREVFAGDLAPAEVMEMITPWCQLVTASGMPEFIRAAATVSTHTRGIYAAVTRGLSNGRHEGLNNKIRTMIRRSYGFHTPEAALALIMLACGPLEIKLPYHR